MKISVKDSQGNVQGEIEVPFVVVEDGKGTQAVHDTVVAFRAAQRMGTACTKTMGEVAGTGKKPWRQKGTGRARSGSFQSPLWRGGGVVFGPKPRDFGVKTSKKTRQLALRKALSERLRAGHVLVLDAVKLEAPKTKAFVALLGALGLKGTTLIVDAQVDRNLALSARNIPNLELATGADLNTYQVLRPDHVVITKGALEVLGSRLKGVA